MPVEPAVGTPLPGIELELSKAEFIEVLSEDVLLELVLLPHDISRNVRTAAIIVFFITMFLNKSSKRFATN